MRRELPQIRHIILRHLFHKRHVELLLRCHTGGGYNPYIQYTCGYHGHAKPDSTEAIEGVHFTIGDAIILPDSTTGVIPVTIYRNELKGNYSQGYTRYKLCLQLVKDDIFTPTLDSLHQVRVFRFDNAVDQPAWYNAHGEKHWQEKYLGKWHPYKLIKMVEYYHAIETILPETYKKMVDLYGENLEHIPNGDPYQFRTIFVKYIYSPMYEFFNDPENYEMIKSQFPDFPFGDFPNPYAEA